MDKKKLTLSLYRCARVYFLFILLPVGLFIGGFTVYHFIQTPELFSYQTLECAESWGEFEVGCSEPVNASSPYTGGYTPRVVDLEEYEELEKKTASYQLRILLVFILGIGYLVLNALHKRGKL